VRSYDGIEQIAFASQRRRFRMTTVCLAWCLPLGELGEILGKGSSRFYD